MVVSKLITEFFGLLFTLLIGIVRFSEIVLSLKFANFQS